MWNFLEENSLIVNFKKGKKLSANDDIKFFCNLLKIENEKRKKITIKNDFTFRDSKEETRKKFKISLEREREKKRGEKTINIF